MILDFYNIYEDIYGIVLSLKLILKFRTTHLYFSKSVVRWYNFGKSNFLKKLLNIKINF